MLAGIMGGGPSFSVQFSASSYNVNDFGVPPGDARSTIQLQIDGDIFATRLNGANTNIGTWVTGTGWNPLDYDFQWQSGFNDPNYGPSDPIDVWINGSAFWGQEETGIGLSDSDGLLRIRPAGGGTVIDTAGVNLSVEAIP